MKNVNSAISSMISFVYFDLGGVVVKDFSASNKWDLLRQDLGINDIDKERFATLWRGLEKKLCTDLPVEDIAPLLEEEFSIQIPKDHSLLKNFVKYFEKNESIWSVIDEIKKSCGIGLLTSMYVGMLNEIVKEDILPHVVWNAIIDSSIVGYAKPDRKIYEIAQEEIKKDPSNILFIDNVMGNIEAAQQLGWQTFLYDSLDYEESSKNLQKFFNEVFN